MRSAADLLRRAGHRYKRRPHGTPWSKWERSRRLDRSGESPCAKLTDADLHSRLKHIEKRRGRGLTEWDEALQREWSVYRALPWWSLRKAAAVLSLSPAEQEALGVSRCGETLKRILALVIAAARRGYNGFSLSKAQALATGVATSHGSWWRAVAKLQDIGLVARTKLWRVSDSSAPVELDRNHYAPTEALSAVIKAGREGLVEAAREAFRRRLGRHRGAQWDAGEGEVVEGQRIHAATEEERAQTALGAAAARMWGALCAARSGTTYRTEGTIDKEGHFSTPPHEHERVRASSALAGCTEALARGSRGRPPDQRKQPTRGAVPRGAGVFDGSAWLAKFQSIATAAKSLSLLAEANPER